MSNGKLLASGLCLLAFSAGALGAYFNTPVKALIERSSEALYALQSRAKLEHDTPKRMEDLDAVMARASVHWDKEHAYNGYTLVNTWSKSAAYLVDMDGRVVHRWEAPFSAIWPHASQVSHARPDRTVIWDAAALYPNGDLLAVYTSPGVSPYGYGLAKLDKNSKLLWTYDAKAHHYVYIADDHTIYALTHEFAETPFKGYERLHYPIQADTVVILSPEGKELSKISVMDAFAKSHYADFIKENTIPKEEWDITHTNSVVKLEARMADKFPQFKAGDILLSLRNINTIAIIDPDTQTVIWAATGAWKQQHSASFLDNGHILLFDNKGSENSSSALELDPQTNTITWRYPASNDAPLYTEYGGFAQRLPGGDTLITETRKSHVLEVTPEGKIVWDYALPKVNKLPNMGDDHHLILFHALRYSPEEAAFLAQP